MPYHLYRSVVLSCLCLTTMAPTAALAQTNLDQANQAGAVEQQVRQQFQENLEKLRVRVEKTEQALEQIKAELARREELSEELIAARVAEISSGKSTKDDGVSAEVLSTEAWRAWQKQDLRTAEAKFKQALAKDPKLTNAMNGLGWVQLNSGATEDALATFEKTLVLEPTAAGAMNGVGQALIALGRMDEAETKLTKATNELIKQYGEASVVKRGMTASWFGLVRVYLQKGEPEKAAQWADRYLKHKPDDQMMKTMLDEATAD